MTITRRGLLAGIIASAAAPVFVRPTSLMPLWLPRDELQPMYWPIVGWPAWVIPGDTVHLTGDVCLPALHVTHTGRVSGVERLPSGVLRLRYLTEVRA